LALTGKKLQVNGLNFHVVDEGEGQPVLLLHGFPDSSDLWRHQIPALVENGFRVIAPDQRGFGESDKPQEAEAYTPDKILLDALGILDQLGVQKAHVVGHDWGAAGAWSIAGFVPDRVDKLVVMSVAHPEALFAGSVEQYQKSWYMLMFQYPWAEDVLKRDNWKLMRAWLGDAPHADQAIENLSRTGALTAGLNWYRGGAQPEGLFRAAPDRVVFPPVKVDTMGIWSDGDLYLTEAPFFETERYVQGKWRYEGIEGATHWMQLDKPEEVNKLLLDFLKG
jgi:pimeloyl-ACP methyl ester carboxylesterase